MNDDAALLRRYADEGSEPAFAELVRRHVDLVYAAALRRTNGDSHRAADVAQQVFTTLAREARKLSRHTVLGAWLHTATRNAALNLMISESRRRAREIAAVDPAITAGEAIPDWERVRPVIDTAIDELPESDRAAVVLRYLERRAFADIGAALHVSEDAARMRTERALEKLRVALSKRGITSTAAALAAIVSSQPVVAAPAGLAATLAAQSLALAGTGVGMFTAIISSMKLKLISTAAVAALVAFFIGSKTDLGNRAAPSPPAESSRQTKMIVSLTEENERLKAEVASMSADVAKLSEANTALTAQLAKAPRPVAGSPILGWMPRYERQRVIMGYLRQLDAARAQFALEKGQAPGSVHELVGLDSYIKTVRPVGGEDYSNLSMALGQPLSVTTEDGMTVTYDPSGANTTRIEIPPEVARAEDLSRKLAPAIQKATVAYRAANPDAKNTPNNPQALIPYFASQQDGADFLAMIEVQKAAFAAQKAAPR